MGEAYRVLLVDDQILYREGLRELINRWDDFTVAGEAADGQEAVDFCKAQTPDLILMDIQMPRMNGIEAIQRISSEHPDVCIVVLTVSLEDKSLFEAIRLGARGYILKDVPARQLHNRLQGVMQGEVPLSGKAAAKVLKEFNRRALVQPEPHLQPQQVEAPKARQAAQELKLSQREKDIIHLVALGLSNEEIGARLYLSTSTVKKQLSALMLRLDFENRIQVAVFAAKNDL